MLRQKQGNDANNFGQNVSVTDNRFNNKSSIFIRKLSCIHLIDENLQAKPHQKCELYNGTLNFNRYTRSTTSGASNSPYGSAQVGQNLLRESYESPFEKQFLYIGHSVLLFAFASAG